MLLAYRNMEPEAASIRRLKSFWQGPDQTIRAALAGEARRQPDTAGRRGPLGNVAAPVLWLPVRWSRMSGGRQNIKSILAAQSTAQRASRSGRWRGQPLGDSEVVGLRSRPGRRRADDELRLAATWAPGQGWVARICLMLKRLSNSITSQLAQSSRLSDHLARARCPL